MSLLSIQTYFLLLFFVLFLLGKHFNWKLITVSPLWNVILMRLIIYFLLVRKALDMHYLTHLQFWVCNHEIQFRNIPTNYIYGTTSFPNICWCTHQVTSSGSQRYSVHQYGMSYTAELLSELPSNTWCNPKPRLFLRHLLNSDAKYAFLKSLSTLQENMKDLVISR